MDGDEELNACIAIAEVQGWAVRKRQNMQVPGELFSQVAGVHWEKFHHKFEKNLLRILKHNTFISLGVRVCTTLTTLFTRAPHRVHHPGP